MYIKNDGTIHQTGTYTYIYVYECMSGYIILYLRLHLTPRSAEQHRLRQPADNELWPMGTANNDNAIRLYIHIRNNKTKEYFKDQHKIKQQLQTATTKAVVIIIATSS